MACGDRGQTPYGKNFHQTAPMSASLIGLSDYPPPLQCRCRSRARASLRNRHQGPSIMGFEDGVEQSSLIGHLRSSAFRLSTSAMAMPLTGSCFSSESAPRPFHHGIRGRGGTIFWAALPSIDGRTKRTCELTLSIVPRGTSFHCSVDLGFSPIGFDPEWFSCCCRGLLPGPAELGAINPDAVHDYGQAARQRHDRLLHPAAPGDLHGPGLEP